MTSGLHGPAAVMDEERLGSVFRAASPSILSFGGQFLRMVPPVLDVTLIRSRKLPQ